jgi:hypothetical protein
MEDRRYRYPLSPGKVEMVYNLANCMSQGVAGELRNLRMQILHEVQNLHTPYCMLFIALYHFPKMTVHSGWTGKSSLSRG